MAFLRGYFIKIRKKSVKFRNIPKSTEGGLDNFPKINKRGGPNKARGGWTKSEKLINVPPCLLGTVEYCNNKTLRTLKNRY